MRTPFIRGTKRFVCLVGFAFTCGTCLGQSLGTTFSDLWWNPSESGWGVTVDHQQDVMFLTFFIYRTDGTPYWVTALLNRSSGASLPFVFSGDVYENHGPYFGSNFNPSAVGNRKVGTATFSTSLVNSATLAYSVDGVTVTKSLQRQTLRLLDFSGVFNGIVNYTLGNCPVPSNNGQQIVQTGQLTILHSGSELQMLLQTDHGSCTFDGAYSQSGSIGAVSAGRLACSDGTSGTFSLQGLQWTIFGMSAAISAQPAGDCSLAGFIGGTGVH